jgi:hypothetical protein
MNPDDRRAAFTAVAAVPAAARHRLIIPGLQLLHVAWFASTLDSGFDAVALGASGVLSAALYAWFLVAEYRWNGQRATPILFYLGAGIFRLGAGVLFVIAAMAAEEWRFVTVGVYDVSAFLMHGHWLALLGDWCVVAGYFLVVSLFRRQPPAGVQVAPDLWRRTWVAGLATGAATFALRFTEGYVEFGGIGMLMSYVTDYGVAAGVYLMLVAIRNDGGRPLSPRVGVAYVFLGLDLLDGLFSYMKSNILIALLPLVLVAVDRTSAGLREGRWPGRLPRRLPALGRPAVAIVLVAYFFLFVVSIYSPPRRVALWEYGIFADPAVRYVVPVAPYLTDALLGGVPGSEAFSEAHRFPNGVWSLIGRMSVTPYPAWAYRQVETAGTREDSFFEELLVSITPRIVWPDKPTVSFGRDFAVTIGLARSADSARSSVAPSMQGAYYWWGGYFALMLGCALTGAGFAVVWLIFRDQCMLNPVSAMAVLVLCHEGFRWFESSLLGGFPMYLYLAIVFVPLQFAMRYVLGYRLASPARARLRSRPM